MIKLFFIAVVSLVVIVLLRQIRPDFALLVKFAALLLLGVLAYSGVGDTVSQILAIGDSASMDNAMIKLLLKALGICLVAQIAADVCKDCGESALAGGVELLGKLSIVLMALPLATQLVEISLEWINA